MTIYYYDDYDYDYYDKCFEYHQILLFEFQLFVFFISFGYILYTVCVCVDHYELFLDDLKLNS